MEKQTFRSVGVLALCLIAWFPQIGQAQPDKTFEGIDRIEFKSGGQLGGKVISEIKGEDGRKYLLFQTDSGGLLKLDKARLVKRVEKSDWLDAEYQRRLKIAGDNPDLLWKIYEWIKEQPSGTAHFKREQKFLLQRIVELNPDDERARRKLNYRRVDGRWVLESQLYAGHGYVKNGTSWAPLMQTRIADKYDGLNAEQGKIKKALSLWMRDLKNPSSHRGSMEKRLFEFCDASAVQLIFDKAARKEKSPQVRLMFVEAFGRVPTFQANRALCYFAIEDPAPSVRERALTLLAQPHFDRATSVRMLSGYLGDNNNTKVKRAAFAIGELGAPNGIVPLIGALVTQHEKTDGGQPGRMALTFGGNNGGGMQVGGGPKTTVRTIQNDEALDALRKITKQNFAFDKDRWRIWYLENYTLYNINPRVDD